MVADSRVRVLLHKMKQDYGRAKRETTYTQPKHQTTNNQPPAAQLSQREARQTSERQASPPQHQSLVDHTNTKPSWYGTIPFRTPEQLLLFLVLAQRRDELLNAAPNISWLGIDSQGCGVRSRRRALRLRMRFYFH